MTTEKYNLDTPIRDMKVVRLTWEDGGAGVWVVPADQTDLFRAALHSHAGQKIGIQNIETHAIPGEGLVRDLRMVRVHGPDGLITVEVLPSGLAEKKASPVTGGSLELVAPASFRSHWWSCPDKTKEGAQVLDFMGPP